ncbi:MAG: non-canonical purine NTP pyrophosphatase, partial [Chloroflexota bacterium]
MMKLLLATNNAGKLEEMQVLLRSESVELLVPRDLGISLDVAETGSSYLENATLKARAFAQASGLLALADDSGLEVDALGGKPGLYSARFAPQEGANDADRRAYLVEQLLSFPQPWQARFVSVIVLAKP